jgi:hypothetical protein
MIRVRPLLGAAAGLLSVALAVPLLATAAPTHAAQSDDPYTCEQTTDPAADAQNNLQFVPVALNTSGPSADATQPIEFQIKNTASGFGPQSPRVDSITATIAGCRNGQVLPDPSTNQMSGGASTTMSMAWSAVFTWNREYVVVIDATGHRPTATGSVSQSLHVVKPLHLAVPPKKPTGVKASTANGVVTISWSNAEREPDLIAYEVRRAKQGTNDYVTVKDGLVRPTVNSVSDQPGDGAYRYQVIAYRPDVDAGAVSSDATAEVASPAPAAGAGTDGSTGGAGGSASSGGTASGTAGSGSSSSGSGSATTEKPTITTGGAGGGVDLSHFAAVLDSRRSTPTTRVEPPDPGYEETLPFKTSGDDPAVGQPVETGSDRDLGQRLIADPDARRRSLGFVAFGLLLFVLGMTGLFVKGEVNRADELETLDGDPTADDEVDATPVVAAAAAGRRRRAAPAPEPVASAATLEPAFASAGPIAGPRPVAAVDAAATTNGRAARKRRVAAATEPVVASAAAFAGDAWVADAALNEPAPVAAEPVPATDGRASAERGGVAPPVDTPSDDLVTGRARLRRSKPAPVDVAPVLAAAAAEPTTAEGPAPELPPRRARRPLTKAFLGPDPAELDEFTPPERAASNGHDDLQEVFGRDHAPKSAHPATNGTHRRRRTVAPLDAPGLDVPDPAPAAKPTAAKTTAARKPNAANARRAPSRLPARPPDDRRQGRAAVRTGGRGAGEGDRRLPVGR